MRVITFQPKEIIEEILDKNILYLEYKDGYRTKDIDTFYINDKRYSAFYSFIVLSGETLCSLNVLSNIDVLLQYYGLRYRNMLELEVDESNIINIKEPDNDNFIFTSNYLENIKTVNSPIILEATLKYISIDNIVAIREIETDNYGKEIAINKNPLWYTDYLTVTNKILCYPSLDILSSRFGLHDTMYLSAAYKYKLLTSEVTQNLIGKLNLNDEEELLNYLTVNNHLTFGDIRYNL